jgi:prepilin-type N-terminal cleavage/methylation domain-containing protein
MKTIKSGGWRVASDEVDHTTCALNSRHASRFTFHVSAFTLIELLVVIAIMGVLASLVLPVVGAVKKHQYLFNTRAEMAQLETAIERYKAAYGFYPPDNQVQADPMAKRFQVNQLYYELTGTTNTSLNDTPVYQSLNDPSLATLTGGNLPFSQVGKAFGVGGFMNCTKPGGGEDAGTARNFLPDLKPKQVWSNYTNHMNNGEAGLTLLVASVAGPDANYQPVVNAPNMNPWRYNSSSPTNNPGSYDLWVLLSIGGKTNLVCNWSKQVRIVTDDSVP